MVFFRIAVLTVLVGMLLASSVSAKTEITVWFPWSGFDGQLLAEYAERYSELNPEVNINVQFVEGAGVSSGQLQVSIAGGVQPDLILFWGFTSTTQPAGSCSRPTSGRIH